MSAEMAVQGPKFAAAPPALSLNVAYRGAAANSGPFLSSEIMSLGTRMPWRPAAASQFLPMG